eukprot:475855_1
MLQKTKRINDDVNVFFGDYRAVRKPAIPHIIEHGQRITDDRLKANIFNAHFTGNELESDDFDPLINAASIPTQHPPHDLSVHDDVNPLLTKNDEFLSHLQQRMNQPIHPALIKRSFKRLNRKKNHGIGLHISLIIYLLNDTITIWAWFFNLCYINGHFAVIFKRRVIDAIYKKKRDAQSKNGYRQISMYGAIRKAYEWCLNITLMTYLQEGRLLSRTCMSA